MKKLRELGKLFFVIGLIAIFASLNMDATVYGEFSSVDRNLYNIGKLNDRSNYVLVSCCITLIGAIWIGISQLPYNNVIADVNQKKVEPVEQVEK